MAEPATVAQAGALDLEYDRFAWPVLETYVRSVVFDVDLERMRRVAYAGGEADRVRFIDALIATRNAALTYERRTPLDQPATTEGAA